MRCSLHSPKRILPRRYGKLLAIAFCLPTLSSAFAQKQKADLLVTHGVVVTMDAQRHVVEDGAIAVRGDALLAVGTTAEILARYDSQHVLDAHGDLVMPGLINTHTHISMSLFRGLADDLALDDWLHHYIFPAEAHFVTPAFVRSSAQLSLLEMLQGGTTTIADMYYFEDDVADVVSHAGMRGVLGETIIGFPSPDSKTTEDALDYTQRFLDHWKGNALITAAVAPHSIYTCPEQLLQQAAALARKNHSPILMHMAEAPFELELSRHQHGVSPVQYLERIGVLGPDVTGAHCIWMDTADIHTLAEHGVGCSYNPSSNMKTAAGLMPAVEMRAAGVPVGLGTDGAASNNNQDMFEEMDIAAKEQKFARMDPAALRAEDVVAMATIDGARALHMDKQIGSLEAGKKADFVLVNTTAPHATPMYNVYSAIVYSLKSSDVETVAVAGRLLMEDHRMLTLDQPAILKEAAEYRRQLSASFSKTTEPVTAPKH